MRQLVVEVRKILGQGPVDRQTIASIENVVRDALPRLQASRLCRNSLKAGRYLCYRDQDFGFVVMLMVWGRGDGTPIHDHGTWGVEAVLKNALRVTQYSASEDDPKPLDAKIVGAGSVMHNLPPDRDVHTVEHHGPEDYSLSLHIYGREMSNNRQFVPGEGYKPCQLSCKDLQTELQQDFSLGDLPRASSL